MRKKIKDQPIIAVLLPVILLLGVVIVVATSIGPLLNAAIETPLVQVENEEGNQVDSFKTKKDSETFKLIAKEDGIFELKYDENFSVSILKNKKDESSVPIYNKKSLSSEKLNGIFKQMEEEDAEFNDEEEVKSEDKVIYIQVEENKTKGSFYFKFAKNEQLWLKIERKTSNNVIIELSDTKTENRIQELLHFETFVQSSNESSSSKETIELSPVKKQDMNQMQSEEKDERNTTSTKVAKQDTSSSIENKNEKKEIVESSEKNEQSIEPNTKKEIENKIKNAGNKTEEKENKGEKIVSVPTETTKKTLEELEAKEYEESDSLRTPKLLNTKDIKMPNAASEGTIGVRDAKIVVKTGTESFDADNNPGHDKDNTNNIVRSFDQIIYLVSFSVQNESTKTKYSNIRYRVISKLPDALQLVNGTLVNIGEIANGENYDLENEEQYSEGIMESVISDTGQIFVPVTLSVFGAPHGTSITPEFSLEIVDAVNDETGETEEINKVYDSSKISQLTVPETKVSAKPSISVELVQGEIRPNSVLGSTVTTEDAYDVAAITTLKPIDGRATGDYRGSTFPSGEITYNIKQKGTYQKGAGATTSLTSAQFNPFYVESYAPAVADRTSETWKTTAGGRSADLTKFVKPLSAPHAKTYRIYNSQPVIDDKKEIGVFNAGDFSITRNAAVTNENYSPTYNPYTYLMNGARAPTATAKSFSSLELIFSWNKKKTADLAATNGWTRYDMTLYIDSVTYNDNAGNKITSSNSTSINYPNIQAPSGEYIVSQTMLNEEVGGRFRIGSTGIYVNNASRGAPQTVWNYGEGLISIGSRVWFANYGSCGGSATSKVAGSEHLTMWDPSGFEYDTNYSPHAFPWSTMNVSGEFKFGVAKNIVNTPPYTMKIKKVDQDKTLYDWYDTPEEAKTHGDISAALYISAYIHNPSVWTKLEHWVVFPLIVKGPSGDRTQAGNPLVNLGSQKFIDKDNNTIYESVINGTAGKTGNGSTTGVGTYKPTVFTASGATQTIPMEYYNHLGDTAFVKRMNITTKTEVEKSLYQSNEEQNVKVQGVLNGSETAIYDTRLTTTLPKGMSYKLGTSVDGLGNPINDPLVTNNSDGTTTLKWTFSEVTIKDSIEVNFKTTLDQTKLTYGASGYTDNLQVNTVGEMWVTNNTSSKDDSSEGARGSFDTFMVQRMQQVVLSKEANKLYIEVGENDPVGEDTTISYEITLKNESLDNIVDGRLLDVLPFDNDGRGTKFSGDYTITDVQVTGPSSTITFSNSSVPYDTDPNTITGWTSYNAGVDSISKIKDAKAILVSTPKLAMDETIKLKITIQPKNQKAGDVLVNNAQMNSDFDLPVSSQAVWTRVYGRDLTGYVWYDDDYDGLIGTKSNGAPEDPVENIPVKLYRTSLKDSTYKKELVKESLLGEKFIDASGNSLVKTGADGKYKFENLPEGNYVAEFMVGDIVVTQKIAIVTKEWQGTDVSFNSKADPDPTSATAFKTPSDFKDPNATDGSIYFNHPKLADLPALLTGTDKVHHIPHVNAGLTRLSKVRLFKYEEGSVIDVDKNGHLSDAEVEASTTNALAGAEFQLYKGKKDDPDTIKDANKIGDPVETGSDGWLEFGSLPQGYYTIVETKAPDGFELVKNPIEVYVPTYNYIAIVHVPDSVQTKLPFTGSTKAMRIILISAACLLVIGMTGVFLHFRPIKVRGGN